ncbi:MAG: tetratricopeptide repeat protein [Caldilineaceae bacterium]
MSLQITLFGAPSIQINNIPVTGFISSKASALVYFLAATSRTHTRDALATLLWGSSSDEYAKKSLRNVLSNLRGLLGSYLEITRSEVRLLTAQMAPVDLLQFEATLVAAQRQPANAPARAELLTSAVALLRGELLEGFQVADAEGFEEWLRSTREQFHLLSIQAWSELVAFHAQQGDVLTGIQHATRLLALDPLREESHRYLMLLLALNGQTGAAIAQFQNCQRILSHELGVPPSAETRQLYDQIVTSKLSPRVTLPTNEQTSPPAAVPKSTVTVTTPLLLPTRHNLPAELTPIVGREREVAQIVQTLEMSNNHLLTISGMGGVGKSRLALHAAYQLLKRDADPQTRLFPDGIYFIALAAIQANGQGEQRIAAAVADALQLPLAGEHPPLEQLIQSLAGKTLLLILDNCEHLPMAALVSHLLQQTQSVKCLTTSRVRLNVRGEQILPLAGLAVADPTQPAQTDALRLFERCAQSFLPDFALDETTTPVAAHICRLLNGLPLGIELAASWVRLLPLEEIPGELQRDLDLLENSQFDAPAHQRNLRLIFERSWRLLSAKEQEVLRRLAIFRGGFRREAAASVAGASLPVLAALLDQSLLQRVDTSTQSKTLGPADTGVRYSLHPVIQQYAYEQLSQANETNSLHWQHAHLMANFLAERQAALQSHQQQAALRQIYEEIENIRAAWQWLVDQLQQSEADQTRAVQLLHKALETIFQFYDMRSWFQEGESLLANLNHRLTSQPIAQNTASETDLVRQCLQAKVQARQGWFAFHLGRTGEARRLLETSLQMLRQLSAEAETLFNLNYLGAVLRHQGDFAQATHYLLEGLELAQRQHDRMGASVALNILGQIASLQGNLDEAHSRCQQALQLKRELGDRWGMTYSLTYLGRVAQEAADYPAAEQLFAESLAICGEIEDRRGIAFALQNLADTALAAGRLDDARQRYEESLQLTRAIGNRADSSLTMARLGDVACLQGQLDAAQRYLQEALCTARAVQSIPGLLAASLGWSNYAMATGQPAQAIQPLQIILAHPASSQSQKRKAEALLTRLAGAHNRLDGDPNAALLRYVQNFPCDH